jgi:hypothetical protein
LLGPAKGLLGAGACAALVLTLAARPWRGRAAPTRAWGAPLALGLASAAGFWLTRGRPSFPPAQAVHWLFYAALVGGAYGAFEALSGRRAWLARGSLAVLLPLVLLEFQRRLHWSPLQGILWTAGLAAYLFATWSLLSADEREGRHGSGASLGLGLAAALSAGSYGLAGGALFAQLAAASAGALVLCGLLGWWRGSGGLGAGGVTAYSLVHFGELWAARWLFELSTAGFVLLSLVPLSVPGARLVPGLPRRAQAALAFGGPALLAAAALLLEWTSAPAASPYG